MVPDSAFRSFLFEVSSSMATSVVAINANMLIDSYNLPMTTTANITSLGLSEKAPTDPPIFAGLGIDF